jgi:hypothetical protein
MLKLRFLVCVCGAGTQPRLQTEDEEIRRFLQLCVDEDGSAISWALYSRGSLSTHCNARFAAMYMNENELEAAVAQDNCRAEVVWRRCVPRPSAPQCLHAW